MYAILATTKNL